MRAARYRQKAIRFSAYARRLGTAAAFASLLQLGAAGARAQSAEGFYSGKTISILVGNEAGGGYDTMARLFARHLGDHIPGRPSVVVQNMPGAGGLSAANYFVNVAPQDGTELALVARTALLARMIAPQLVHFDVSKFNWLGTLMSEPGVLVVWRTAPVQSAADLFRKTLIVGGAGRMDDTEATPKLLNSLLGAKLKVVGGYPGLNSVTNAMERGELEGVVDWSWSNAKQVKPHYLRDHLARVIMQLDTHRAADLPDVPIPSDFAKDPRTKQLFQIYFTTKTVSRPVAAPPGAPADRVALLRSAFGATIADPAFLADAAKSHIPVAPSSYEKVLAAMKAINDAPPQLVDEMTGIFAKN